MIFSLDDDRRYDEWPSNQINLHFTRHFIFTLSFTSNVLKSPSIANTIHKHISKHLQRMKPKVGTFTKPSTKQISVLAGVNAGSLIINWHSSRILRISRMNAVWLAVWSLVVIQVRCPEKHPDSLSTGNGIFLYVQTSVQKPSILPKFLYVQNEPQNSQTIKQNTDNDDFNKNINCSKNG